MAPRWVGVGSWWWLVGWWLEIDLDCQVFFGQCLFVFQAAFVKSRKSRSTSFGARYPRAE